MEPLIYYKQKNLLIMQGVMLAIAIGVGIWMVGFFRPHNYIAQYSFIGFGAFLLLVSVFGLSNLTKRLQAPNEILIVDEKGIVDRTSGHGVPLIKWEDVKGIREEMVALNKMVRIDVQNTEQYIAQGVNAVKRKMLKNNMKMYGSPFVIHPRMVGQKNDNLLELMRIAHQTYKEKHAASATETPVQPEPSTEA